MVGASLFLLPHLNGIVARSLARALFLIGLIGVAGSGTPLHPSLYIAMGLLAAACLTWRALPLP